MRIAALDACMPQRSSHADRLPRPIHRLSSRQPALADRAPWESSGAGWCPQRSSKSHPRPALWADRRSRHKALGYPAGHRAAQDPDACEPSLPEVPPAPPGRWRARHGCTGKRAGPSLWSRWLALMTPADRASRRREDLCTIGPSSSAKSRSALRPPRSGALDPLAAVPRRVSLRVQEGRPRLLCGPCHAHLHLIPGMHD
jgi:hypothetical protein